MARIDSDIVDRDEHGRVAYITVDNRARLNILDRAAMADLSATITELTRDDGLRVIVLSGAGAKAFIGGADIREMATLDVQSAEHFISALHQVCVALRRAPVPVIARISGYCLGAGLEIAAACDIRIAADNAVFGMPEVKVGIPSVIEAALLPRLIGWGRTSQLLYTGDTIDATQAAAWGLIEQSVDDGELDRRVEQLVDSICNAGAKAIRAQKALLLQWEKLPLEQAVERGIEVFAQAYQSDEPERLMQHFLHRKTAI